jgi:hypothetical protein
MARLGSVTFDAAGVGAMGRPSVYNSSSVEPFAKIF